MVPVDSNGDSAHAKRSHPSLNLTDAQLRSALRFAERRLRSLDTEYTALQRAYRHEIATIRRLLIDRLLNRMMAQDGPLSVEQQVELRRRFERHGLSGDQISGLARTVSRGRTDAIGPLTEIEGMALLLRLEH